MPGRRRHLPPGPPKSRLKRWYEKGSGPARLAHDKIIVEREYPALTFQTEEDTLDLYLEGVLVYESKSGIRDEITTRVVFPPFYPDQEPRAYDIANRFPHTLERHFYEDSYREGRCCLWLPPKSKWSVHDPEALLKFLDELVMFFERQLIFDATGKWPGPQYEHGYDGYKQWAQELLGADERLLALVTPLLLSSSKISRNEICPCGSNTKYKKCHLQTVDQIRREVPTEILTKALQLPAESSLGAEEFKDAV